MTRQRSALIGARFGGVSLLKTGSWKSRRLIASLVVCTVLLVPAVFAQVADTPAADPNLSHPNQVVTGAAQGYTISGLVTHLRDVKAFKYGVALFPGSPGIMRLREEGGQTRFEMRGNFLVRSRRHWLDDETLVIVVDAPSDQWSNFHQGFRETARYGADVAALLNETARRFGVEDWTFVGTSEGSVSAFHAARMNPLLGRRMILTASLFRSNQNGQGLSRVAWEGLSSRLLWVHHESDPCAYTSCRDAQRFAEKSRSPLMTVRGGGAWRGEACQAFTAHGFVGIERETVVAMRSWVKSGAVPRDVAP
jgi:pimeloyl-ACP methyl ester carboxylesterase